jgi:hypothetical protein
VVFAFLALAAGFLAFLLFPSAAGQVLMGLAISVHAYSIFDLTPFRSEPRLPLRVLVMGLLLVGLMVLYGPVMSALTYNKEVIGQSQEGDYHRILVRETRLGLSLMPMLVALAMIVVAAWLWERYRARPRPGAQGRP